MYYFMPPANFYNSNIHGDSIPEDAVEISDALYEQIVSGLSDKVISVGSDGLPYLQDRPAESYQDALDALNSAYQADVTAYSKAFSTAYLADGTSQDAKQQAIRDQYAARKTQYSADYAALKTQYGV